jgi:hypothetical protein
MAPRCDAVVVASVDRHIRAHVARKLHPVETGTTRQHAPAAQLGELDGQRSDAAESAMNNDALALLQREGIVDSLQRRQPGRGDRVGMLEIEVLGNMEAIRTSPASGLGSGKSRSVSTSGPPK